MFSYGVLFIFFLILIQFVEQRLHLWKGNVVLWIVAKRRWCMVIKQPFCTSSRSGFNEAQEKTGCWVDYCKEMEPFVWRTLQVQSWAVSNGDWNLSGFSIKFICRLMWSLSTTGEKNHAYCPCHCWNINCGLSSQKYWSCFKITFGFVFALMEV